METAPVCSLQHQEHAVPQHQHLFTAAVFYQQTLWRLPSAIFTFHVYRSDRLSSYAKRFPVEAKPEQRLIVSSVLVLKSRRSTNFVAHFSALDMQMHIDSDQLIEFRSCLIALRNAVGESIINHSPGA